MSFVAIEIGSNTLKRKLWGANPFSYDPILPFQHTIKHTNHYSRQRRTLQRANPNSIAAQIFSHRRKLGIDQIEAARRIGISPTTLSFWECGLKEPDEVYRGRIMRFLNQSAGQE